MLILRFDTVIFLIASLMVIVAILVFAFARKVIKGYEAYSQYHYVLIALITASCVFYYATTKPLFYLDLTLLTISITFSLARVGCVRAGCCYGKVLFKEFPWRSISSEYPQTSDGRKIKLFPVQRIEIFGHLTNVAAILSLISLNVEPGIAFVVSLSNLALFRFYLEWYRGDNDRPFIYGLYETQWLSIFVLSVISVLGISGVFPFYWFPLIGLIVLTISAIVSFISSREYIKHQDILSLLIGFDSLVLKNSTEVSTLHQPNGWNIAYSSQPSLHLSFSHRTDDISVKHVEQIRRMLISTRRISHKMTIIEGKNKGVFHLISM